MRLFPIQLVRRSLGGDGLDSGFMTWSKSYANLPERYMMRKAYKLKYKPPVRHPAFSQKFELTDVNVHTKNRPWSEAYQRDNNTFTFTHPTYAEPIKDEDWMWFRGDRVEVLTGKDKGKQGYINCIVQERNWVYVEGLNAKRTTMGADNEFPGMMTLEEEPLVVTTDIKLVDPQDEKSCEVEWRYTEDGERTRISLRSGHILPMPSEALQTIDYKTPAGYAESKKTDTKAKDVEEITYVPKLCTFEMDIMEMQGIKEDRVPPRTFMY